MALWIKAGWRISNVGLKQWIWDAKQDMIDPYRLVVDVFGPESSQSVTNA